MNQEKNAQTLQKQMPRWIAATASAVVCDAIAVSPYSSVQDLAYLEKWRCPTKIHEPRPLLLGALSTETVNNPRGPFPRRTADWASCRPLVCDNTERAMGPRPKTIDDYLAALSADKRSALEALRKTIRSAAPKAEECISYGLAAFRLDGKPLVAIGAFTNHCAFYPMSSSTLAAYQEELEGYETSKGTIRFPVDKPLPAALVRKLVRARIAEQKARAKGKRGE
jgi:uncharacterized protein YdhG (YjbR/CyaY superfamily)